MALRLRLALALGSLLGCGLDLAHLLLLGWRRLLILLVVILLILLVIVLIILILPPTNPLNQA